MVNSISVVVMGLKMDFEGQVFGLFIFLSWFTLNINIRILTPSLPVQLSAWSHGPAPAHQPPTQAVKPVSMPRYRISQKAKKACLGLCHRRKWDITKQAVGESRWLFASGMVSNMSVGQGSIYVVDDPVPVWLFGSFFLSLCPLHSATRVKW